MKRLFLRANFVAACALAACHSPDSPPSGQLADVMAANSDIDRSRLEQAGLRVLARDGHITGVHASDGNVLVADDATREPLARAEAFLQSYGGAIGMNATARSLLPFTARGAYRDELGTHVRLDQTHHGLPVHGGELVVHMNDGGIVGVNGRWFDLSVPTTPVIDQTRAKAIAIAKVNKLAQPKARTSVVANAPRLAVFRAGLVDKHQRPGDHLAWAVEVVASGVGGKERFDVWFDAIDGSPLASYQLNHSAKFRVAYAGAFSPDVSEDPFVPGPTAVCREDLGPTGGTQCVNAPKTLYDFSGQVHDLFSQAFQRDSYDGMGIKMRTVNLVNNNCPNAYWDGETTNYCPGFELDDVVAHEWGHAYTEYTHDLIYQYQSGALNESYSDIWGETLDLLNNADGVAGANNGVPAPAGNRWLIGEDLRDPLIPGPIRDMWDPDRLGNPGATGSTTYHCGDTDLGGVHSNSGVPNHAYALLVDGTDHPASCTASPDNCRAPLTCNAATSKCEMNGQSITAIGFQKAAAIYYRAMTVYQTRSTDFPEHADAIEMSCNDLVGSTPRSFLGLPAATAITTTDCDQVKKAMLAVQMRGAPPCIFEPLLKKDPPPPCRGATETFKETWANGFAGSAGAWTLSNLRTGDGPDPYFNWEIKNTKPGGVPGKAAFATDANTGGIGIGQNESGSYHLASPQLTAPASGRVEVRFDHFVETEYKFDGGQLYISVNGGSFALVPADAFTYNGYNDAFDAIVNDLPNTNPRAPEPGWTGTDPGLSTGSWGTTVLDLTGIVAPGQNYRLRFDFSRDIGSGITGWYVGDVIVNSCPALVGPVLSAGMDYEDPDTNGSFTLEWMRPATTGGPDELQQGNASCAPTFIENADGAFAKWVLTQQGTPAWESGVTKPAHATNTFRAIAQNGVMNAHATMTMKDPVTIPAGSTAKLTFQDWFMNEGDDAGYVELSSDNGATWAIVYTVQRSAMAGEAQAALTTEDLFDRTVDLTPHAGKSIKIRFRYQLGMDDRPASTPNGWYVDNIRIDADDWRTLANVDATSQLVEGRASGTYCFRVRTNYTIAGQQVRSDWSNVLPIVVDNPNAVDSDGDTIIDPNDNCVTTPNTDQTNGDGDPHGDACDACFGASQSDDDADGRCNEADNCPGVANPDQADSNNDGVGDACTCAAGDDPDNDLVCSGVDNCPNAANPDQADADNNGVGDACQDVDCEDLDNDGVCDDDDDVLDDGGCGCRANDVTAGGAFAWLVVGFAMFRRRRRRS